MIQHVSSKKSVMSRAYRLVKPYEVVDTVIEHELADWMVVVEPLMGSICHADMRYYSGNRRPEALQKKLPMALIHEGIGTVVQTETAHLPVGQRVVIVPNIPGSLIQGIEPEECCPACRNKEENYCYHGQFLGSGVDGIAQSRLVIPAGCAIPVPDEVPNEIAVLLELCTVSYQALAHVAEQLQHSKIVVFGDGPVGYLAAAILHHVFHVSKDRLLVFGVVPDKLAQFDFATCELVQEYDFTEGNTHDIALDCTGGRFSENAINQAIDILRPGGHLILMGVTEERVPINTRDVLEKGITMRGSSRSSRSDFYPVLSAMKDPSFQRTLGKLLPEQSTNIASAEDFDKAMENAVSHLTWQKTILHFHWS
ncbi:alcohol dehydrogenase catalytic domain-containing protein [Paenibacillus nasutitermitis]|uniref:Ribitol-5-phosphate 2-dehydrogenase n=1 Tax=Paenibacillus nasutitermitis TaxID=1652958 RepID=A0A916Z8L9_9BACL|nr:alcohol dehydrogenase catalytic domain-containing protein [Paenibacillus nasutitermitis]GGD81899.1 ribitol-5-phosphate 2-dehydrogenase [Paenibacillus nasutitermitis]